MLKNDLIPCIHRQLSTLGITFLFSQWHLLQFLIEEFFNQVNGSLIPPSVPHTTLIENVVVQDIMDLCELFEFVLKVEIYFIK